MISAESLRAELKIKGTHHDTYLAELEERAVAYIQRRLGYFIGEEEAVTEYLEGSGTLRLWLTDIPALDIDEVIERVAPGADGATIVGADANGFLLRGSKLVRKNGLAWVRGYEYEVTYTRGYESLDAPSPTNLPPGDVQGLVTKCVAFWWERRVPVPRIGEQHAFPVPHHLDSGIIAARRQRA